MQRDINARAIFNVRFAQVSDEELLKAIDSMRFDNGWTELDLVEEGYFDADLEKVTGKSRETL